MHPDHAWRHGALGAALLALAACGGGGGGGKTEATAAIQYAPTLGVVPSPNDLAFQGSQDGTLNETGNSAVDTIDGFSTTASATVTTTEAMERTSIESGGNVRVFAVATAGDPNSTTATGPDAAGPKGVTGLLTGGDAVDRDGDGELTAGMEYQASIAAADRTGRTLAATPLAPLAPDTTYMVVVTDGLRARSGGAIETSEQYRLLKRTSPLFDGTNSTVDSLSDAEAQQLEPLRQLVDSQLAVAVAGAADIDRGDVLASWTFTTQTIGRTLDEVHMHIDTLDPMFVDTDGTPNKLTEVDPDDLPVSIPNGKILTGTIVGAPYYLEPGTTDPRAVRTGSWRTAAGGILTPGNRTPANNVPGDYAIPVLVALPESATIQSDVVIFQHGIASNRTAMLGIANALTAQDLAVVAIDLPLHGITDTGNGLYAGSAERTFNVDLVDNDTGAAGPDGRIDPSGEHFINLESLLTARDNLRQAAADLFTVTKAVSIAAAFPADLDGEGIPNDFANGIHFLGHSLGGIVGGPFLATEEDVSAAVLGMSGGHITRLLDASPTIGPEITAGLEAEGLTKGTPAYERFLGAAQTVIDKGDPINYTRRTALGGTAQPSGTAIPNRNVLALEVVGGNSAPPDQVVPNNVVEPFQQGIPDNTVPAPNAGTDPLVWLMMMDSINADPAAGDDYAIRYTAGDHASLLDPSADTATTMEMQTNVASFLASDGTVVQFAGTGTVAAP